MTTVTGTLLHPVTGELATGYVRFRLVNERGERVTDATLAGGAVVGESIAALTSGAYSVSLPGNIDIESDQQATYWQRLHGPSVRRLLVPTSGTWDETDDGITVDPPQSSPDPVATNLITSAVITAPVAGLSVNVFQFANVTGTIVTVPDLTHSVKIEGSAPLVCPATANIVVAAFITNIDTTESVGVDYQWLGTANLPGTVKPTAVLPPHSAGDYQLVLYSFSTVTLNVDAQPAQPAGLWVYGV